MAAGQHSDQHLFDDLALTDDNFIQLITDSTIRRLASLDGGNIAFFASDRLFFSQCWLLSIQSFKAMPTEPLGRLTEHARRWYRVNPGFSH